MENTDRDQLARLLHAQTQISAFLTKGIRDPRLRTSCAEVAAQLLNRAFETPDPPPSRLGTPDNLQKAGAQHLDTGLPAANIVTLREHFTTRRGGQTDDQGRYNHPLKDIVDAPYLLELATSEDLLAFVGRFLGTWPTLASLSTWWSEGGDFGLKDQIFHRDVADVRFCKVFIYLTDVTESDGPHQYVLGSQNLHHVKARLRAAGLDNTTSFEDQLTWLFAPHNEDLAPEVEAYLKEDLRTITGTAGTAFIEDTFGIHRARIPEAGHSRLLFQILYAINIDYATYDDMTTLRGMPGWRERVGTSALARHAMRHWDAAP